MRLCLFITVCTTRIFNTLFQQKIYIMLVSQATSFKLMAKRKVFNETNIKKGAQRRGRRKDKNKMLGVDDKGTSMIAAAGSYGKHSKRLI